MRVLNDGGFRIEVEWATVRTQACKSTTTPLLIQHVQSDQCPYNDGPNNGGEVKHWSCWKDSGMMYALDPVPQYGESAYRVRHIQTDTCWFNDNQNGATMRHWGCWNDSGFVYMVDNVGNSEVRLRHRNTGKCAYADGGNGGAMKVWGCWDDPGMRFKLLPQ